MLGHARTGDMQSAESRREWVLAALDQYEVRLLRYALRLLGGESDLARDAVQQVEHVVLQAYAPRAYWFDTLAMPNTKRGADHRTREVPALQPTLRRRLPQAANVDTLRDGGEEFGKRDWVRAGEQQVGRKNAGSHSKALALRGKTHAIMGRE